MSPLSPAQQRIWHLTQAGVANLVATSRLWTGPLNIQAFTAALVTVVERHDALRLAMETHAGGVAQVVKDPDAAVALELADFSASPERDRETAASQWVDEVLRRPFDLGRAPLLRVGLARLNETGHVMVFAAHQIVCDAASLSLVRKELLAIYRAYRDGAAPSLSAPVRFLDYAAELSVQPMDHGYWRRQLAGAPLAVTLPPDHPRPSQPWSEIRRVELKLSREFGTALAEAARRNRCTTFIVVHAALAIALERHCGQSDVVIGTPVSDRDRPELERAVGPYTSMLALRTNVAANQAVHDLLRSVRSVMLAGLTHRSMPFVGAHEPAHPHPMFQVVLVTDPAPPEPEQPWPGVRIVPWYKPPPASPFDLTLFYASHVPKLYADFSTGLYEPATIERFLHDVARILKSFTQDA